MMGSSQFQFDTKKWVLIVDDDQDFREMMISLIDTFFDGQVRCIEAADGTEATTRISQQKFHCIITDIEMPKKNGNAFIRLARQNHFNESTPIVVLSGNASEDVETKHPFVYFLGKPFDNEVLLNLLKTSLEKGSTKNMLSANLYNSFVNALHSLSKKLFQDEVVEVSDTQKQELSDEYSNLFLVAIECAVGSSINTAGFILSDSLINNFIKKLAPNNNYPTSESKYRYLANVILQDILKKNKNVSINKISINKISDLDHSTYKKPRISTPIIISDLKLEVFGQVG